MDSSRKDDIIAICKVNDLIDNYEDMMDNLLKLSLYEFEITNEEMELFTRCFKSHIGFKRSQYRKIIALITKDELVNNKNDSRLFNILKVKLANEIIALCEKVIVICNNVLKYVTKNKNKNKKAKLFFVKTLADHYRYIHEINEDQEFKEKAASYYQEALKTAEEGKFPLTDITYLTFFLNYSVFLHDTMNDKTEAIKRAKLTLHAALRDTEEITDNNQKDIILICQMIKDNLSLWKNEIPEELNNL